MGVEFWKVSEDKTKEFFKKRGIVSLLPQDILLEKFAISGYESLSTQEKTTLFNASEK